MEELSQLLTNWFQAELHAETCVDKGRTVSGSAYHSEALEQARYAREELVEAILNR